MKPVHRGFSAGFLTRELRDNGGCSVVTFSGSRDLIWPRGRCIGKLLQSFLISFGLTGDMSNSRVVVTG